MWVQVYVRKQDEIIQRHLEMWLGEQGAEGTKPGLPKEMRDNVRNLNAWTSQEVFAGECAFVLVVVAVVVVVCYLNVYMSTSVCVHEDGGGAARRGRVGWHVGCMWLLGSWIYDHGLGLGGRGLMHCTCPYPNINCTCACHICVWVRV